jgi:hypothetical protein
MVIWESFAKTVVWKCCAMIKEHGDANAKQVSLKSYNKSRCAELAYPWTPETNQMVDAAFVDALRSLGV